VEQDLEHELSTTCVKSESSWTSRELDVEKADECVAVVVPRECQLKGAVQFQVLVEINALVFVTRCVLGQGHPERTSMVTVRKSNVWNAQVSLHVWSSYTYQEGNED